MKITTFQKGFLASIVAFFGLTIAAPRTLADLISPNITGNDDEVETVKPNTAYYGTGIAGRQTEASTLRFEGERLVDDGKYEQALEKLGRAVQLDPGDGTTHVLHARALSGRLKYQIRTTHHVNDHDISSCLREWKMILRHDADGVDQSEAKTELRLLAKIQKELRRGELAPEVNRLASHYHSL